MLIRDEGPSDEAAIATLIAAAFLGKSYSRQTEHSSWRRSGAPEL